MLSSIASPYAIDIGNNPPRMDKTAFFCRGQESNGKIFLKDDFRDFISGPSNEKGVE